MKIYTDRFGHRYEIIEELSKGWCKAYQLTQSGMRMHEDVDYVFTGANIEDGVDEINRKRLGW